jgi:hypothetical protein
MCITRYPEMKPETRTWSVLALLKIMAALTFCHQEMQGTLIVTLQNSAHNQGIDEYELRRQFQHAGDIKSIRPVIGRPELVYHSHRKT